MAALIRQYGLRVPFTWLPLSILNQDAFYDHHLLYHVYLSLFAGGSDQAMLVAAKWASVFMPAAAFVAIWWLLRGQQVRYAAIWALGLFAVSEAFLYRMSMPRAQAASLLVLALGLHWLLQRKFVWLIPLGFLYVWLYNAFPLLIVIAVVYAVAAFLTERRIEWKAVIYPGVGIALGLIINPYFPQNITFIVNHLAPKIGELGVSVGNEWYPYDTWVLIENSGFALAAFLDRRVRAGLARPEIRSGHVDGLRAGRLLWPAHVQVAPLHRILSGFRADLRRAERVAACSIGLPRYDRR